MNPYKVLGVPVGATLQDIKIAHRALARQYHPDLNPGYEAECAAVNTAWDILSDPVKRRTVDRVLHSATLSCDTCAGKGKVFKQKGFKARVSVPCPVCGGTGEKK